MIDRRFIGRLLPLLLVCAALTAAPVSAAVPAGFTDERVADVAQPTALAFRPDGSLLVTTQTGDLRIINGTTLLPQPALSLGSAVCSNFERGLLGVAVDPDYTSTGYIYLFYTFNRNNACPDGSVVVNRVSRFTMVGDSVVPGSEKVLVDNMTSRNGNHNAGSIEVAKDGLLYISIGDGGVSNDARRRDLLAGKILRVSRADGSPAPGNPWLGEAGARRCGNPAGIPAGSGPCAETFASGLRNPFRLAFDQDAAGVRFLINDVGQNTWEEIDEGLIGANYGWPDREGPCANGVTCTPPFAAPPAGLTNPIFAYNRARYSPSCASITGGAFVPNASGWPAAFQGDYLFSDYVCGRIFQLDVTASGGFPYTAGDFVTGLGGSSAVHLRFDQGPGTRSLYYTTYAGGGEVRRIGLNQAPTAVASASPPYTAASTLNVTFDGSASTDPDGDSLTYAWTFGDGASGTGVTTTHTYTAIGMYTASLIVTDDDGRSSAPATVRIDVGNTPPDVSIDAPLSGTTFAVGEVIALRGSASDAQDGATPALRWEVLLHHNEHTHPFLSNATGPEASVTAPPPEDLLAAETSYLEVRLTATDSTGLAATVTRRLDPRKVDVTFLSEPAGLRIVVNGQTISAPATITSWEGWGLGVVGVTQAGPGGTWYALDHWSQGGEAAQTVITPAQDVSYTAVFAPASVSIMPVIGR